MRRLLDKLRRDEGMSIIELTAASVIGLLVLSSAYLMYQTGMTSFRKIENDTIEARAAATSMQRMTRAMREMTGLSKAKDYEIEFLSDPNDDGVADRVRFYIPAGTSRLMEDTATPSGAGTMTIVVSQYVNNANANKPLFSYYSAPGVLITGDESARMGALKVVRLNVITSNTTTPAPVPYNVQTDVFLRNAQ
jgi:hypothetical protein